MRTLGIDLSAQPKKTAACRIEWRDGRAVVKLFEPPLEDTDLVDLMADDEGWVAIDAPFGWPVPFSDAVASWRSGEPWPRPDTRRMRLRTTDCFVRTESKRNPLSVSSDRIAVCAMRCAWLLSELARERGMTRPIDRTGRDRVVEVYPGAALPMWSNDAAELVLDPRGYKGAAPEARAKREALVAVLERSAEWLELGAGARELCIANDDALDAVLCALVARAAACNRTLEPAAGEQSELAAAEGWIHLPERGSLAGLASGD